MGRAVSWNWELQFGGTQGDSAVSTVYPTSLGEFSEGEEGRIDVADGDRKYKIRDQIYAIDEIEITVLIKNDRYEYDALWGWADSGGTQDAWLVAKGAGRDAPGGGGREERMVFLLSQCQCAMGKKSAFDRQSKTFETRKFFLIPEDIQEISKPQTRLETVAAIY